MNKFLLSIIMVLGLFSNAMAFSNNEPGTVTIHSGLTHLVCYPLNWDPNDPNPVVRTEISMLLAGPDVDWRASNIKVWHVLSSGRVIDRDTQYIGGGLSKEEGKAQWHWFGHLYTNPSIQMVGEVWKSIEHGWRYQETLYKNNNIDQYLPEFDCHEVNTN